MLARSFSGEGEGKGEHETKKVKDHWCRWTTGMEEYRPSLLPHSTFVCDWLAWKYIRTNVVYFCCITLSAVFIRAAFILNILLQIFCLLCFYAETITVWLLVNFVTVAVLSCATHGVVLRWSIVEECNVFLYKWSLPLPWTFCVCLGLFVCWLACLQ